MIEEDLIEGIILGCTELPLILTKSEFDIPFLNTTLRRFMLKVLLTITWSALRFKRVYIGETPYLPRKNGKVILAISELAGEIYDNLLMERIYLKIRN